jgi:hypothetical protein
MFAAYLRCLCLPVPQVQLSSLQTSLADAERRVYESELIRRKLHNTIQVCTHTQAVYLYGAAVARQGICTIRFGCPQTGTALLSLYLFGLPFNVPHEVQMMGSCC